MMKNATEQEKHSERKMTRKRAPRNPSARKQQIIDAAADLIAQEGSRKITNRAVAERANVPLGSTTQYFKNINELRRAGLAELSRRIEKEYDDVFLLVEQGHNDRETLAAAITAYISDRNRVRADAALYAAAIDDPAVRDIAKKNFETFLERCKPYMNLRRAKIFFAFTEGALIEAYITGKTYDEDLIREAISLILGEELGLLE